MIADTTNLLVVDF